MFSSDVLSWSCCCYLSVLLTCESADVSTLERMECLFEEGKLVLTLYHLIMFAINYIQEPTCPTHKTTVCYLTCIEVCARPGWTLTIGFFIETNPTWSNVDTAVAISLSFWRLSTSLFSLDLQTSVVLLFCVPVICRIWVMVDIGLLVN